MEKSYNAIVCRYDLTLIKMAIEIDSTLEYNFGANFENQAENLSISVRIITAYLSNQCRPCVCTMFAQTYLA